MEDNEQNKTAMAQNLAAKGASEEESASLADLEKEIDAAVEKVHVEGEDKPDEESEGEPAADSEGEVAGESDETVAQTNGDPDAERVKAAEAEEPKGEQGRDEKGQFTRKAPFSDALLERAVRAGVPMSEAREFPNEKLLSATVERLESVQKNTDGKAKPAGGEGKNGETQSAEDPAAAIDEIPDLDPAVYDEKIVKTVAVLKGIARSQAKELVELRGKGSKDFLATQLEGVKEFTKGDQSKETAVREKFDMLKAGYKATNKDVSDVTVFAEAAQLVLGGDMRAAAQKNKAEAAKQRNGQTISRAAGQRVKAKADPLQAVGDEIDALYFKD